MHTTLLVLHGLLLCLLSRSVAATAVKLTLAPASTRTAPARPATTSPSHPRYAGAELFRRDATESELITCGYLNGNADFPRTAQPGFDCRVDTAHGIWGFCPSTVIEATDCGLAAACRDGGTCSSICRFNSASGLTTITCPSSGTNIAYCSTAMLTFGVDQSYGYIACGAVPKTENYIITPTFTPSATTSSTTSTTSTSTTSTSTSSPSSTSKTTNLQTTAVASNTDTATSLASSQTPVPANETAGQTTKQTSSSTNLGAVIGGVLGGIALVCGSAIAVVFLLRRNRSNKKEQEPSPAASKSTPFQPAPPYAPYTPSGTPPPRPPQPPQTQLYPQVYHEVESSEKYKPSFDHAGQGGHAYAVELPSNYNN